MSEAVFDTSILIDHLRENKAVATSELMGKVRDNAIIGYISTLTITELFAGEDTENETKRRKTEELISLFSKIEVNEDIARIAGNFRRRYGVKLPDAIIAATAFNLHCKVFTQDFIEFKSIKEISVEKPY